MKTMKISVLLLLLTFACACGQKADDTFNKPMYFNQGLTVTRITFSDGTFIETAPTVTGSATWESILYKPLNFTPIVHTHDYATEITNKPPQIPLQEALSAMDAIVIPKRTTAQIEAMTPTAGSFVYDVTLNVLKIGNGSVFKILITAN